MVILERFHCRSTFKTHLILNLHFFARPSFRILNSPSAPTEDFFNFWRFDQDCPGLFQGICPGLFKDFFFWKRPGQSWSKRRSLNKLLLVLRDSLKTYLTLFSVWRWTFISHISHVVAGAASLAWSSVHTTWACVFYFLCAPQGVFFLICIWCFSFGSFFPGLVLVEAWVSHHCWVRQTKMIFESGRVLWDGHSWSWWVDDWVHDQADDGDQN